ncbi:hypothetical protein [Emcibacter sp.]|uniref:hypothetical protein n=1 Tax=Emcibacter sp. TaxID=1979954 RepID=UPI002AA681BF|nr:hypothetical protein [Emcibacter sp.]
MNAIAPKMSDEEKYREYQKKVEGENINPQTLLATDYLNHFNEVHMLLDMLSDMPDCLEDVQDWHPKSYQDHFRDSAFTAKDLAVEAYNYSPPEYRQPFEETVNEMDKLVLNTISNVTAAITTSDTAKLNKLVDGYRPQMEKLIEDCGAIINGARGSAHQQDIDSYFSEEIDESGLDQNAIDDLFG